MNRSLLDLLREGGYILYVRHGEAQFAFGRADVQIDPFWFEIYRLSGNLSSFEQNRILSSFRSVLETKPMQGFNRVVIAHSFPQGVGLGQIPDMGTVIVRPLGLGNGFEVIRRLSLEELANLLPWL